jgi:RimJ/RimL family protein N-acetyltransferase
MFAITPRLLLRPSWPEDAATLHGAIADQGIVRNLARAPWPYTPTDAASFVALQHTQLFPNALLWTRDGQSPQLVGSCGLGELDGEAELGYWIARPFWGRGYATEAARAVIQAARALGHKKLVSSHFIDNPASGRVLRKVGFRPTGKTQMRFSAGRGRDVPCLFFERDLADAEIVDMARVAKITPVPKQPYCQQFAA